MDKQSGCQARARKLERRLLPFRGMLPKLLLLLGRLMIWAWILTGPWDGDVSHPDVNGTWR
jgi:hypothetical protein